MAKPLLIQIPTHFRFKDKKEAKEWGCTTDEWLQIEEIDVTDHQLSTPSFAWVYIDDKKPNLEFTCKEPYFCHGCNDQIPVTREGDLCDYCYEAEEELKRDKKESEDDPLAGVISKYGITPNG